MASVLFLVWFAAQQMLLDSQMFFDFWISFGYRRHSNDIFHLLAESAYNLYYILLHMYSALSCASICIVCNAISFYKINVNENVNKLTICV